MTRLEIKKAVEEASEDEPFTMPFFLAGLLVEEMKRQNIPRIIYEDTDFNVTVWIKPAASERISAGNGTSQ